MNTLSLFKSKNPAAVGEPTQAVRPTAETLEDVLMQLTKWGRPYLHCDRDGGWSLTVDANITPLGAKFEVRSDFHHKTPMKAALQCRERMLAAVNTIRGAA